MYTEKERRAAIELYEKYDKCATQVVRELGYPSRATLYSWYQEYETTRTVRVPESKAAKYTPEQKRAAIAHWLEHGRSFDRRFHLPKLPLRQMKAVFLPEP
jgi:transposase-like protein